MFRKSGLILWGSEPSSSRHEVFAPDAVEFVHGQPWDIKVRNVAFPNAGIEPLRYKNMSVRKTAVCVCTQNCTAANVTVLMPPD